MAKRLEQFTNEQIEIMGKKYSVKFGEEIRVSDRIIINNC